MPGRTLHLHIGNHAAGDAAISAALRQSTQALTAAGLRHYDAGPGSDEGFSAWLVPGLAEKDGVSGRRIRQLGDLAERLAALNASPVISCPDLAFIYRPADLIALQRQLSSRFDNIRLIAYVLRQDQQSLALNQHLRSPCLDPGPGALLPDTANNRRYLDYATRLGFWARIFGQENLSLRAVDRRNAHAKAIAEDFLTWLGLADLSLDLPLAPARPGRLARLIDQGPFRNKALLQALIADDEPDALPARAEVIACLSRYADGNRHLAALLGLHAATPFAEDFSEYPAVASNAWNEASANRCLQGLLQGIAGSIGQLSADDLHGIAQAIAPAQAPAACKLERLAAALRGTVPIAESDGT